MWCEVEDTDASDRLLALTFPASLNLAQGDTESSYLLAVGRDAASALIL